MTALQRRILICDWYEATKGLNTSWDSWKALGVGVEAPFPSAAWIVHQKYTEAIEELTGLDEDCWLSWFLYDRPQPVAEVVTDTATYEVTGMKSFLDMIDAEYPLGEPVREPQ